MSDIESSTLAAEHVLVADDELANVELFRRLFERDVPCRVIAVMNADAAVRVAIEQRPAVVLLDLGFPNPEDALNVCRRIRLHHSRIEMPIILITAQNFRPMANKVIAQCFEAGADDFIERIANDPEKVLRVRGKLVSSLLYRTVVRQAAALRAIGGKVAHDLRTPLTSLSLSLEAGEISGPPYVKTALKRLKTVSDALARHTSQNTPIDPAPLSVSKLFEDVRELAPFDDNLPPSALTVDSSRCSREVLAVKDLLLITVLEMISNAASVSPGMDGLAVSVVARDEGELVCISIRDNGAGIPAGYEERIFEERYTTRARGTGLGLAYARADIVRMGGTLELVRDDNPGAHFKICLPAGSVMQQETS
jgi:two-component system, sensor histidine kinase and response regulator